MEKIYHIYAKEKCLFHSLSEDEFPLVWNTIRSMVGIMKTDYEVGDLSFEELCLNKKIYEDASH